MRRTTPTRHRRSSSSRVARLAAAAALILAAVAGPAHAAAAESDHVLRVGTVQDLDSMNPWNTALETGFEVFTLNYELLVGFDKDLQPTPGFAESWSKVTNPDGTFTWTFKIPEGKQWSDGTPATAEDARWTLQFVLDAVNGGNSVGLGYLDPDLTNAGITSVSAPDPMTLVINNTDASDRILEMYIPILPKHIWKDQTLDSIAKYANAAPVVGSGPYQAQEWQTGQFVRFERNPHFTGQEGAEDTVVLQFFKTSDSMATALKRGELDYAQGFTANEFDGLKGQPDIETVNGTTNGWTMLDFNTYGKDIPKGGASTKALRDPAFRDALGYAIDKPQLIQRVLGGYGTPGTTQVPPFQTRWHVDPDHPRTFDIDLAKQKLLDAGYPLDASGKRLDKEGKPITLRLYLPTDSPNYPKTAPFIVDWFGQLGIKVVTSIYDTAALLDIEAPPEAGKGYTADWDMIIWGWTGYADPNPLLQIFTTSAIGDTSDSFYSNPVYDQLFEEQNKAATADERHALMAQMQNVFYDDAPYHMLYYDDTLAAYRTDKFSGWQNQPANGVPLFGYGSPGYTVLQDATAATPVPSTAPASQAVVEPSAAASSSAAPATPVETPAGESSSMLLPLGLVAVVVGVVAVAVGWRRRSRTASDEDE